MKRCNHLLEGKLYRMKPDWVTCSFKGIIIYIEPSISPLGFKFITQEGTVKVLRANPDIFESNSVEEFFERVL